jgi:hypothetical protein
LNSALCACQKCALLLEPCPQDFFCSGHFQERILLFIQACLDHDLPILCFMQWLGWQAYASMSSFFSIEMGSHKFFWPDWPQILILSVSSSCVVWNDRSELPHPAIGWDGVSLFVQAGFEPRFSLS